MKAKRIVAMVAVVLGVRAAEAAPLPAGTHTRELTVDGRLRSYLVHVPPQAVSGTPLPVVVAFHGGGSNGRAMQRYSALHETAESEGFLAVFPNGTGRLGSVLTWNAGSCCGYAERQGVDDVAFTAAVLDDLAAATPVDRRRVYATGMSNGAMMAYRAACALSHRIAAIAPVAGGLQLVACEPARPVPVLHIHGTADEFAAYGGGRGPKSVSGVHFTSVDDTVKRWISIDGCPKVPAAKEQLPDLTDDGTRVTRTVWGPGKDGAEVVLLTIDGGGHTWPGAVSRARTVALGTISYDVAANDAMWAFFRRHPMPARH